MYYFFEMKLGELKLEVFIVIGKMKLKKTNKLINKITCFFHI